MFKNIAACIISASLAFAPVVTQAASFGKTSSSSSSPSKSSSSGSKSSGGISKGQSVGMQRSQVTQSVRDGSYKQKQQKQSTNTTSTASNKNRQYQDRDYTASRRDRDYQYQREQRQPYQYQPPVTQGHSDGALLGAAILGHAIGSSNNRSNTTTINNGGTNGHATTSSVPSGQSYDSTPTSSVNPSGTGNYAPASSSGGMGWFWALLLALGTAAICYVLYRFFMGSNKPETQTTSYAPIVSSKEKAENELIDNKDDMFVNFQRNNKPSGIDYIQENSETLFFNAVRDSVVQSSDTREVRVVSLGSEVVNCEKEGSRLVASVHYKGKIVETENGDETSSDINEVWHFLYEGNVWKVAGIEPI